MDLLLLLLLRASALISQAQIWEDLGLLILRNFDYYSIKRVKPK